MTPFICNNYFTYVFVLLFWTSVKEHERKREGIGTISRMHHKTEN